MTCIIRDNKVYISDYIWELNYPNPNAKKPKRVPLYVPENGVFVHWTVIGKGVVGRLKK